MFEEGTKVDALAEILSRRYGEAPQIAVILGSGWKELASHLLNDTYQLDLSGLDNWPAPKVEGHGGQLVLGYLAGTTLRVGLCTGRVHAYEGYSAAEIVRGVRSLVHWGAKQVLLLNAAGSLRPSRPPGSLMPIADHLNWGLPNPMQQGQNCGLGANFLNLVDLYDPTWLKALCAARSELSPGVYAGCLGPSYETPAEIRMLQQLGADAVGMSTIPEAIAARALGAKVMAISLLTNWGAGLASSQPSHEEVLATALAAKEPAVAVLEAALRCGAEPASFK